MVVPFLGPKMAPMGSKITQYCPKWLRCLESDIRNQLHQISACLAIVLRCHKTSLRQFCVWALKWLLMAPKWHKMAWNDMNSLELSSETISIWFLLFLRSFWVVTWLVCDNFEFGAKTAKNGPKWPKKAPNDQKWPECLKSDWNWLIWCCHSSYRPILSTSANFIQQWGWTGQKSQFWHPEKFFMYARHRSYFIIFIYPKCKISEN